MSDTRFSDLFKPLPLYKLNIINEMKEMENYDKLTTIEREQIYLQKIQEIDQEISEELKELRIDQIENELNIFRFTNK
jgi:hypothetical protein